MSERKVLETGRQVDGSFVPGIPIVRVEPVIVCSYLTLPPADQAGAGGWRTSWLSAIPAARRRCWVLGTRSSEGGGGEKSVDEADEAGG